MARRILIRPVITEKSEMLTDQNSYTFIVDKKADKAEIREAVHSMFDVEVTRVNTMIMPSKRSMRYTKRGYVKGSKSAYKKAIVTLAEGSVIDFYDDI